MIDIVLLKPIIYWGGIVLLLLLEQRISYRPATVAKQRRWLTNIPLSIINGVVYHFIFTASILAVISQSEAQRLGLLNTVELPFWLHVFLGILILDFSIYLWHLLTHSVPLLWRFHRVHHSDMNMDVTTANRFHLGEFLVTGLLRLAIIYTFGIPLLAYILFEILINISIQFHHSSIKVPEAFERIWMLLFVPPALHRIHHSVKIRERDANYGVLFSIWDRMLGTLVTKVDQGSIIIGIGSHRKFEELGFWQMLLMPFTKQSK